jgi:hypothetical protein
LHLTFSLFSGRRRGGGEGGIFLLHSFLPALLSFCTEQGRKEHHGFTTFCVTRTIIIIEINGINNCKIGKKY